MKTVILFDIGGTKTRVGIGRGQELNDVHVYPTPRDPRRGIPLFVKHVHELSKGKKIQGVYGGIAGPLNVRHTGLARIVRTSAWKNFQLQRWASIDLKSVLERELGVKARLENDAALAAAGEGRWGSAKKQHIAAYVTVGTGFGGCRLIDGKIDHNFFGFEPGHQLVNFSLTSGGTKSLESFVSGAALHRRYGKPAERVVTKTAWQRATNHVAAGLVNIAAMWSPEAIVLGGSLFQPPGIKLAELRRKFQGQWKISSRPPALKAAHFGDYSGLYGALAWAQSPIHVHHRARAQAR